MPKPALTARRRSLLTFDDLTMDQLVKEAASRGLKLATYLKSLVLSNKERARGAGTR